ncbi:MAG: secretin N-terminal domain-containing protein [Candidatus Marithrix sp.]
MKKLYILIIFILIGCSTPPKSSIEPNLPKPLREPIVDTLTNTVNIPPITTTGNSTNNIRFQSLPSPPSRTTTSASITDTKTISFTTTKPIVVNIESLPLPAFINEIFGNLLNLSFEINKKISRKKDLVTLRVSESQTPEELYNLAIQVLANYKVGVEIKNKFIQFIPQRKKVADTPSLIIEGLASPQVPPSHRPIIHFVTLKIVTSSKIKVWLEEAFKGHELTTKIDAKRNAIILIGRPQIVNQAVRAIEVLDQPLMRSQHSLRIEPAILSANSLADQLVKVLDSQGYAASKNSNSGSVIVLPFQETNAVIVFAGNKKILNFVQQWATKLDYINPNLPEDEDYDEDERPGLFSYQVKHIAARLIVKTINQLLEPIVGESQNSSQRNSSKTKKKSKPNTRNTRYNRRTKVVVDENRNTLYFIGSSQEWIRLLPVIKNMDVPPKQVLIEATIADIVITEKDEQGIEWILNKANLGGLDGTLSSMRSGVGSSGLIYTLSNAGQVRAVLNAFASNSRATILATPRLMVRSGSSATIEVGNEIPTLSSQATSADLQLGGNSAILQQIQYRRTGTLLKIKPTVYAGRRVDLQISQEVSNAQENTTSQINSPEIFNRSITTELSLQDGHSVLLGGLISTTANEGDSGIPFLKDLPLIGQFFRVNKSSSTRTELVIMIVPYVIDNDEEAKSIADTLQRRLKLLPNIFNQEDNSN